MPADSYAMPRLSFSYDEWMHDTSRTLQVRSAGLKALDILVDSYIRTPSPNNLMYLRRSFESWKTKQGTGDAWRSAGRNAKSDAFTKLDADLKGVGDSDMAYGLPGSMSEGMSNARLGLLYLFSNLACDQDYFRITTSGIMDLASSSLGFASDRSPDNQALSNANTIVPILKEPLVEGAQRIDDWMKAHRESKRTVTSDQLTGGAQAPAPSNGATRAAQQQISEGLQKSAREVAKSIALQSGLNERTTPEDSSLAGNLWDYTPGALRKLCDYLGGQYLADAMPFVGSGMTTVNGLISAVQAGTTRYLEYAHGKGVSILPGHPSTIVKEIRRAMDINVCSGLYQTLKGGAKLAVEGVTAGAGSPIASLAFSLVETIVSTTWKVHDLYSMDRFFTEAKRQYTTREQRSALHTRPIAFNAWYRKYAVGTPAISVLALTSGICGDKMRFLKMYTAGNEVISQSAFDAGVTYVDELKVWGATYLAQVGYKLSSNDALTQGLLTPVHQHPDAESFAQKRVLGSVKAFLGG